jgi:hypothetical protein
MQIEGKQKFTQKATLQIVYEQQIGNFVSNRTFVIRMSTKTNTITINEKKNELLSLRDVMKSQFIKNISTRIFSIFTGSIARTSRLALQPGDQLVRRHDQGVQRPTAISTTTTTTTNTNTTTTTTSKLSTFYVSASVV